MDIFSFQFNSFEGRILGLNTLTGTLIAARKVLGQPEYSGHVIYQNMGFEGRRIHFRNQILDQSTLTGALLAVSYG